MNKSLKRNIIASLISLMIVAVMLGSLLFYQFSTAKYTSSVDGKIEYEAALFNTVLLGNLSFTHKATDANGTEVEYVETDGKLGTSILVDSSMEFGAIGNSAGDMTSNERRLRPGSVIAIPFTVTNGTTLPSAEAGEEGNLAETDILYSISLITTINLPLEYDVYSYTTEQQLKNFTDMSRNDNYNYADYTADKNPGSIAVNTTDVNWGTKLFSKRSDVNDSPLIGFSRTYEVKPTTYDGISTDEEKNLFSLERDVNNENISVDRYMLVISWPNEDVDDRSTRYMKEIDILEVRLEVLSWVKNSTAEIPSYTDGTKSVLTLSTEAVGNENYYFLPTATDNPTGINADNVFARHTLPFYATRSTIGVGDTEYNYVDFVVTNSENKAKYTWNATTQTYDKTVISYNTLENGRIAIAVPVQDVMGTVNNYTGTDFEYIIEYNGKSYPGILTNKFITTEVWTNDTGDENIASSYKYQTKNAYQIVEFYETQDDGSKALLELANFSADAENEQNLRLIIRNNKKLSYDNTDNFKILVYSAAEGILPLEESASTEALEEEIGQ